ncbi:MAG: NAD-dependent epimerase/dehydratase family protein [Clostridia bacterium]|nr:NAD-dependent epimerase/dehydratase family protein [Clostridia bacterium]
MKKILITGGTTFVSKYAATYFVNSGYEVYVLNRNTKPQVQGVNLIEGDRHNLHGILKDMFFDVVADITAYNDEDIIDLLDELGSFGQYIMISSSAVYPEYGVQPFAEDSEQAANKYWGAYGTDKIKAEKALLQRVNDAYILRPPYLYGPMNNVYREAFVFDCALADRKFYLPKDGSMKLQFFHVEDLCRLMEIIIEKKPADHIMNVGNSEAVSIKEWVTMCYECLGKSPVFENVCEEIEQRKYFSFYNYEYSLDVTCQNKIYPETISLKDGLRASAEWYSEHSNEVNRKPLIEYIDSNLVC